MNKFTPEELKQFPEWLRDIMRTTPEYPRATRKGEEFDPGDVPVLPADPAGNRAFDPRFSRKDLVMMAANGTPDVPHLQEGSSNFTPDQQRLVDMMNRNQYDWTFGPGSPGATREDLQTYVGGRYSPASGFAREGGWALAPKDYYSFTPEQRRQLGIMDVAPRNQRGRLERYFAGGGNRGPAAAGAGGIRGGPFAGWNEGQVQQWHSGAGLSQMGYPSFTGNTAGPGGQQLAFETTSYNVPGYGWVPRAQLANAQASNNPLDYFNPFGGTTKGGSGTGVPTQKAVGTAVGTLSNLLLPGSGFITGPLARWVTHLMQGGMSKQQAQQVAQQQVAQGKPPPMPSGGGTTGGGGFGFDLPKDWGGLGKPMGYFDIPNYMGHGDFGAPTTIPGSPSGQGTIANTGITINDVIASGVTPRSAQSVGAPSGGMSMGFGGGAPVGIGALGGGVMNRNLMQRMARGFDIGSGGGYANQSAIFSPGTVVSRPGQANIVNWGAFNSPFSTEQSRHIGQRQTT